MKILNPNLKQYKVSKKYKNLKFGRFVSATAKTAGFIDQVINGWM